MTLDPSKELQPVLRELQLQMEQVKVGQAVKEQAPVKTSLIVDLQLGKKHSGKTPSTKSHASTTKATRAGEGMKR
jgi:hypothetical protein